MVRQGVLFIVFRVHKLGLGIREGLHNLNPIGIGHLEGRKPQRTRETCGRFYGTFRRNFGFLEGLKQHRRRDNGADRIW